MTEHELALQAEDNAREVCLAGFWEGPAHDAHDFPLDTYTDRLFYLTYTDARPTPDFPELADALYIWRHYMAAGGDQP